VKVLYDAEWEPALAGTIPEHSLEAPTKMPGTGQPKAAVKKVGAYRPPGARGTQSTLKLHEDIPAENQTTEDDSKLSKSQIKNKKRKEAKARAASTVGGVVTKKKSAEQQAAVAVAAAIVGPKITPVAPDEKKDVEKKIRNLNKKLRQIDALKEKQAAGEFLQGNQQQKVNDEATIQAEVDALAKQLETL
jgi:uncharacterized protein with WD repeat